MIQLVRTPPVPLAALSVCLVAGCPQAIHVDGADGGLGDGGVSASDGGGVTDSGSADAAVSNDGGSDGGSSSGQDAGNALTWGAMAVSLPEQPEGVQGSASNDVYVVTAVGFIFRFDGSQWTQVFKDPSNYDYHSVWVDPGTKEVFAGGDSTLVHCSPPCTQQSAFATFGAVGSVTGVCGISSPQKVFAVSYDMNQGTDYLYQWNGSAWGQVGGDTGAFSSAACWVAPDGSVFIAAQSYVSRYANSQFTQEPVDDYTSWTTSDIASQNFYAVWGDGTTVFAAGSHRRVLSRESNGHWTFQPPGFNPSGANDFHAVAGWTSSEVYAMGTGDVTGQQVAMFGGSSWSFAPDIDSGVWIWGLWAAGPNEYFAVGTDSLSGIYVLHGTR